LATGAIIAGSIMAMAQSELKRILAYSTVTQVGFIFLGVALASQRSVEGALLHILNHAVVKALLFLTVGGIIKQSGATKVAQLRGLGKRMPYSFAVFAVGVLSMIGLPGTAGFNSKFYISLGALDINAIVFVLIILFSSLLSATYLLPIIITAFFHDSEEYNHVREVSWPLRAPLIVLAGACIVLGVIPSVLFPIIRQATQLFIR
ncbi:MAG: proton-conducting transporter membrane subunit, partial [bacterium]|nr:proton-conducting transporter membrane subunit [bacterium]